MQLRQAVILVGGLGTRLGALTAQTPKPLLPVAQEPFLDKLLRNLARHGLCDLVLLAQYQADMVRARYHNRQIGGARVRVLQEPQPAGTGGALHYAAPELDDVFLLSNGDSYFDINYLALAELFERRQARFAMALRRVQDASRYGVVTLGDAARVLRHSEKSSAGGQPGLINGGVYVMSKSVVTDIPAGQVSLEQDILPALVQSGAVCGQEFAGYFIDIGVPDSYARAQHELPQVERRKVVFFDRDDTLNRDDAGYTHRVEDLAWMPGAPQAIRRCNDAGRLVLVLTNQGGIARGYYDAQQMHRFHQAMNADLQSYGAHIDGFYHCPHHIDGTLPDLSIPCACRKPQPGLFHQAMADWGCDLEDAVMIGDQPTDVAAAQAFGIRGIQSDARGPLVALPF